VDDESDVGLFVLPVDARRVDGHIHVAAPEILFLERRHVGIEVVGIEFSPAGENVFDAPRAGLDSLEQLAALEDGVALKFDRPDHELAAFVNREGDHRRAGRLVHIDVIAGIDFRKALVAVVLDDLLAILFEGRFVQRAPRLAGHLLADAAFLERVTPFKWTSVIFALDWTTTMTFTPSGTFSPKIRTLEMLPVL